MKLLDHSSQLLSHHVCRMTRNTCFPPTLNTAHQDASISIDPSPVRAVFLKHQIRSVSHKVLPQLFIPRFVITSVHKCVLCGSVAPYVVIPFVPSDDLTSQLCSHASTTDGIGLLVSLRRLVGGIQAIGHWSKACHSIASRNAR